MGVEIKGDCVIATAPDGEQTVIRGKPPGLLGRILGAMSARQSISGWLVEMGEPPAQVGETLDALRERYKSALVKHADDA